MLCKPIFMYFSRINKLTQTQTQKKKKYTNAGKYKIIMTMVDSNSRVKIGQTFNVMLEHRVKNKKLMNFFIIKQDLTLELGQNFGLDTLYMDHNRVAQ